MGKNHDFLNFNLPSFDIQNQFKVEFDSSWIFLFNGIFFVKVTHIIFQEKQQKMIEKLKFTEISLKNRHFDWKKKM